jgi:hypothetical protein
MWVYVGNCWPHVRHFAHHAAHRGIRRAVHIAHHPVQSVVTGCKAVWLPGVLGGALAAAPIMPHSFGGASHDDVVPYLPNATAVFSPLDDEDGAIDVGSFVAAPGGFAIGGGAANAATGAGVAQAFLAPPVGEGERPVAPPSGPEIAVFEPSTIVGLASGAILFGLVLSVPRRR